MGFDAAYLLVARVLGISRGAIYEWLARHRAGGWDGLKAKMVRDCVAEFEGRLELRFLPPYSPELNPDKLVWQDLKTNGVGRKPVESAKELHERVTVHMETLKGLPRKVRSFFKATHTKYAEL